MKKRRVMFLVLLLVIGFASVSTTLILNGVIGIASNEDDFDVIFTSARLDGRKRNDLIGEKKKDINFETRRLTNINEEAVLDYEVTNASRIYDADVVISCNIVDEEENVIESNEYIVIQYEPKSMTVEAGKTESGSITARLIKASTEEQSINIKCTLNASATERDELGEEYIVDKGLMIPVNFTTTESGSIKTQGYFWDYRESITKVVFEEKGEDRSNAAYTFDVSKNQDESVMSYLVANAKDNTKYTLYIQSEDIVILNPISEHFFRDFSSLEEIEGLERVDTSNVTSMRSFFRECSKLKELDVSAFDTSNVTNMSFMFYGMSSLTNINITGVDMSNVIDMRAMFYNCSSLTTLDLSNIDAINLTSMWDMFSMCINLTSIDLSGFYAPNLEKALGMFNGCEKLVSIDLSSFYSTKVESMDSMFQKCQSLLEINFDNWNTMNVISMARMFNECNSLTSLDVSNFDTGNVTTMEWMFGNCGSLINLDLSNFDTSNVTNMSVMFYYCRGLTTLDLSNFDTINVTTMEWMFDECIKLSDLNISNFDFSNVTNARQMFNNMPNNAIVKVKDSATQNKVLNSLPTVDSAPTRPSAWTTANVVVA